MSNLILSWLNDEVQLSKKISNFEYDFSNGYYFGELLAKKNQQLNFDKFINQNKRQARLQNWQFLKPTFTSLGIKLPPRVCNDIMKRKRGVSLNYLYKLKMSLEKVKNPTDIAIFNKTGKFTQKAEIKIIKPARTQFDNMENKFFSRRLNETNKAQKLIDLDHHLKVFVEAQQGIEDKVLAEKEEIRRKNLLQKQERRSNQLNELQRAQAFREDWEQKGYENWLKNQKVKRTRLKMTQKFKETQKYKMSVVRENRKKENEMEVYQGIATFEANLAKFGLDHSEAATHEIVGETIQDMMGLTQKMEPQKLTFKNEKTIEKIRQRKKLRDKNAKERDKRRRKMIVDQHNSQRNFEITKRQEMLVEKLQQHSKQEKEIQYEIWRAQKCQEIIRQNKLLRQDKFKQKKDILLVNSKEKAEKMLEIYNEQYQTVMDQKQIYQRELEISFKQGKRRQHYKFCEGMVNGICDITEACYNSLQDNDQQEISGEFWEQCIDLFLNNQKIIHVPKTQKPPTEDEIKEASNSNLILSKKEFESYLQGKGEWKPTHDFKYDEEDDDTAEKEKIPNDLRNNFYLGDLIELVIDLEHPVDENAQEIKTDIPNWLPLKLGLMGYAFSGKKTLAGLIKDKYNLEVISVEELIGECIEVDQQQDINETDQDDYYSYIDQQKRRQIRELLLKDEEYIATGHKILEIIKSGKEITNEIYLYLILHKIRRTFPNMNQEDFINEYFTMETYVPPLEASPTLKRGQQGGNPDEEEDALAMKTRKEREYKEIMESKFKFTKGWLLLDYPMNYQQAQELEKGLTGFLTNDDRKIPQSEILKEQARILAQPTPKSLAPKRLIRSGIDGICVISIDKINCLKRAFGRRMDPVSNDLYHLDESPPLTNDSTKVERLQCFDDPYNSELAIMDKHCVFDDNIKLLKKWYSQFGFEESQFQAWNEFDGLGERFKVFRSLDKIIQRILKIKYNEACRIRDRIKQKEIDKKNREEAKIKEASEAKKVKEVESTLLEKQVKELKKPSELHYKITKHLSKLILGKWEACREFYITNIKLIFEKIRFQEVNMISYFAEIQRRFIELLRRNDNKSTSVIKFQREFNEFMHKYPDLIENEAAQNELHQRVDDLFDDLSDISDAKQQEGTNERNSVMKSGWVEAQMINYISHMKNLMYIEILQFWSIYQILMDFYSYSLGTEIEEKQELDFEEFNKDLSDLELIGQDEETNEISFPKIDFIYEHAQDLLYSSGSGEEKGGKKVDKKGKKVKAQKQVKKVVKGPGEEEESEIATPLQEELNKAILLEQQNIRYKLFMIKKVTLDKINNLRNKSNSMYQNMIDWLDYNMKVENETIEKLTMIFRDHIEQSLPIQKEIRIEVIDIVESFKHLNFQTPLPEIIPAKESFKDDKFSILQLHKVAEELKHLQNNSGILENNLFLEFMLRRLTNKVSENYFPDIFSKLGKPNILSLIKRLDPKGNGYISVRDFFTYLCILQSPIMNEERRLFYMSHIKQFTDKNEIDLLVFLNCPAWYDITEGSEAKPNQEKFDRPMQIKQLLFKIHKDSETNKVSMDQYLRSLSLVEYNKNEESFGLFQTYYQFLFD